MQIHCTHKALLFLPSYPPQLTDFYTLLNTAPSAIEFWALEMPVNFHPLHTRETPLAYGCVDCHSQIILGKAANVTKLLLQTMTKQRVKRKVKRNIMCHNSHARELKQEAFHSLPSFSYCKFGGVQQCFHEGKSQWHALQVALAQWRIPQVNKQEIKINR